MVCMCDCLPAGRTAVRRRSERRRSAEELVGGVIVQVWQQFTHQRTYR